MIKEKLRVFKSIAVNFANRIIKKYKLKQELMRCADSIKVVIGCGETSYLGWIGTDYPIVDITKKENLACFFKGCSIQALVSEHVWEHLTKKEAADATRNCFDLLKSGGHLRVAVPDGYHCDSCYIEAVQPGGSGQGSEDHKVLYNYNTLSELLRSMGFKVELLEWYDEKGGFHHIDWAVEDGMIVRSTRYDDRNIENPCAYTSLIIDAIKP